MDNLLEIKDLNAAFKVDGSVIDVLTGVDIHVRHGEVLALVGESGSGKTTTVMMVMNLLRDSASLIYSGNIYFEGQDILKKPEKDMQKIRGKDIGMVFQEPLTALNPCMTIGEQLEEVLMLHGHSGQGERRKRVLQVMEEVGLPKPKELYSFFPSQLSGGMKQRVVIAMAIVCKPKLLIADEPTTALDVTTQAQILTLLKNLKKEYGLSIILITHDLGVVAEMADSVAVMYGGSVLEHAEVKELFARPSHPYTLGLMKCIPYVGNKQDVLYAIPGSVPHASRTSEGCIFYPRCSMSSDECKRNKPDLFDIDSDHRSRCMKWEELKR